MRGMINKIFGKYLLLTNTVSSGVLMAAGDLIQQEIENHRNAKSRTFDWKRTGW
jgi:protein Mpv17